MTRALAMEYGPRGIRANCVAPGRRRRPTMWREHLAKPGVSEAVLGDDPDAPARPAEEVADVVVVPGVRRVPGDHRRDDLRRRRHAVDSQHLPEGVTPGCGRELSTITVTLVGMPAVTRRLSADAARRIALAAQGLADPRPTGRVDRRHLRRVFDRHRLIQVDSVNVLVRSQELPLFARLGAHPRTLIADAVADGELFEYWAHMAAIVPERPAPPVPLADGRATTAGRGSRR